MKSNHGVELTFDSACDYTCVCRVVCFRIFVATRERNPNELTQSWRAQGCIGFRHGWIQDLSGVTCSLHFCLAPGFTGLPGPRGCSWRKGSTGLAPPEACGLGVARVAEHQREVTEQYLKEKQVAMWCNAGGSVLSSWAGGCQAGQDIPRPPPRSVRCPTPWKGTFWG